MFQANYVFASLYLLALECRHQVFALNHLVWKIVCIFHIEERRQIGTPNGICSPIKHLPNFIIPWSPRPSFRIPFRDLRVGFMDTLGKPPR